jgi:hypothetical protein
MLGSYVYDEIACIGLADSFQFSLFFVAKYIKELNNNGEKTEKLVKI